MNPQTAHGTAQAAHTAFEVKICGIGRPEDALHASKCGATMIGVVLAESRRQVSLEVASSIVRALREAGSSAPVVGVFVNERPERVREIVRDTGIDVVQLSGDETPAIVAECAEFTPVIKALRFPPSTSECEAMRIISAYTSPGLDERLRLIVDAYHPGSYGGSGTSADWSLARSIASRENIILAGGLAPDNVAQAVCHVMPSGVDVSSGVEREGQKDHLLIEEFIQAARGAKGARGLY